MAEEKGKGRGIKAVGPIQLKMPQHKKLVRGCFVEITRDDIKLPDGWEAISYPVAERGFKNAKFLGKQGKILHVGPEEKAKLVAYLDDLLKP